jgi:hypothetical protein
MLGLVLATSNAPSMYRPRKDWQAILESQSKEGIPSPNELADETDEMVDEYITRIQKGFETLRGQLESYKPDVVVVLGYDDGTAFSGVQVPQICTYTGSEIEGTTAIAALGEKPEEHMVKLRCNSDLAWELHVSLVDRSFDMSYMSIQNPQGIPENGTSSAFTRPTSVLLRGLDVSIVPIFINCHVEPTPSGRRCYAFGQALGEVLEEASSKVALLAVGGLSHDPNGDRAGWIDNRLDEFVLDRMKRGDTQRLRSMFDVDSDTLRGGTGQIRTWITAGAAAETKKGKATVVDYIPALRAITGIAFAHWQLS